MNPSPYLWWLEYETATRQRRRRHRASGRLAGPLPRKRSMHECVAGCCRGQPDDQLALLHFHIPRHGRPHVAGGERADKARLHVATRLIHLIRAEVGVVAPDCSCVVQPSEHWRGDLLAAVALHELGSEVPRTVEEEERQGVRAESGLVDG